MLWLWAIVVAFFESYQVRDEACFAQEHLKFLLGSRALFDIAGAFSAALCLSTAFYSAACRHSAYDLAAYQPALLFTIILLLLATPFGVDESGAQSLYATQRLFFVKTIRRVFVPIQVSHLCLPQRPQCTHTLPGRASLHACAVPRLSCESANTSTPPPPPPPPPPTYRLRRGTHSHADSPLALQMVAFTDFLLADIMTSLAKPLSDLGLAACFFLRGRSISAILAANEGFADGESTICSPNGIVYRNIVCGLWAPCLSYVYALALFDSYAAFTCSQLHPRCSTLLVVCRELLKSCATDPCCACGAVCDPLHSVCHCVPHTERRGPVFQCYQVHHCVASRVRLVHQVFCAVRTVESRLEAPLGAVCGRQHNVLVLLGCRTRLGHPALPQGCAPAACITMSCTILYSHVHYGRVLVFFHKRTRVVSQSICLPQSLLMKMRTAMFESPLMAFLLTDVDCARTGPLIRSLPPPHTHTQCAMCVVHLGLVTAINTELLSAALSNSMSRNQYKCRLRIICASGMRHCTLCCMDPCHMTRTGSAARCGPMFLFVEFAHSRTILSGSCESALAVPDMAAQHLL